MNHIQLSLRAADQPRIIKEDGGVATFATIFVLHNTYRKGQEAIPITVRASRELAAVLAERLTKGTAFVVEGELSYYRNGDTGRERYSVFAASFADITPPKSQTTPAPSHE
jgi:single-stranded DNA-binding protein